MKNKHFDRFLIFPLYCLLPINQYAIMEELAKPNISTGSMTDQSEEDEIVFKFKVTDTDKEKTTDTDHERATKLLNSISIPPSNGTEQDFIPLDDSTKPSSDTSNSIKAKSSNDTYEHKISFDRSRQSRSARYSPYRSRDSYDDYRRNYYHCNQYGEYYYSRDRYSPRRDYDDRYSPRRDYDDRMQHKKQILAEIENYEKEKSILEKTMTTEKKLQAQFHKKASLAHKNMFFAKNKIDEINEKISKLKEIMFSTFVQSSTQITQQTRPHQLQYREVAVHCRHGVKCSRKLCSYAHIKQYCERGMVCNIKNCKYVHTIPYRCEMGKHCPNIGTCEDAHF